MGQARSRIPGCRRPRAAPSRIDCLTSGSACQRPLLKVAPTHYPDAMEKLPAEYEHYLVGKDELHVETVMPIFRESMAEGKYGVHIRGLGGHSEQAFVDESVPYGKIKITVP